jgi:hypothetical protein
MAIFGSNNVFLSSYVLGSINGFVAGPRFPVQKELVLRDLQKRCRKKYPLFPVQYELVLRDLQKKKDARGRPPSTIRALAAGGHRLKAT